LPQHKCARDSDGIWHLSPSDVRAIGGNAELVQNAFDFHKSQRHTSCPTTDRSSASAIPPATGNASGAPRSSGGPDLDHCRGQLDRKWHE
jgi:hypothetical protein